jgi:hypothetical protein
MAAATAMSAATLSKGTTAATAAACAASASLLNAIESSDTASSAAAVLLLLVLLLLLGATGCTAPAASSSTGAGAASCCGCCSALIATAAALAAARCCGLAPSSCRAPASMQVAEDAFIYIGFTQHTHMLRSNPKPPTKYCLSIDPGTQNAGVCAFDSTNQTIVYWSRSKLLDFHESVVRSTDQVRRYLDSITDNITAALKTDDYWVLVEEQPLDSDSKKGIVFNLQLQQAIVMYYMCHGKNVRVLSPSERYKFLGIRNWQQMTRHFRKVSTANAVRQLLEPGEDNSFARRNHDLRVWHAAGENQHDLADALGQVLCYFY